ncbi:hypothetical protein, partial [Flavobacterium sp.]|uniref:hypothetical protein n=1 Tax=Flavobacterium sp. TaxID=239 RepID=UPI00286EB0DB
TKMLWRLKLLKLVLCKVFFLILVFSFSFLEFYILFGFLSGAVAFLPTSRGLASVGDLESQM